MYRVAAVIAELDPRSIKTKEISAIDTSMSTSPENCSSIFHDYMLFAMRRLGERVSAPTKHTQQNRYSGGRGDVFCAVRSEAIQRALKFDVTMPSARSTGTWPFKLGKSQNGD
jgi:hypothetical protein